MFREDIKRTIGTVLKVGSFPDWKVDYKTTDEMEWNIYGFWLSDEQRLSQVLK